MQIHITGFGFSLFSPVHFIHFKCFSESLPPLIGLFMGSSLLWSCHAPLMPTRWWIMAITFFFLLPSALFGPPHPPDHSLLQLTREWSWWPRWLTPRERRVWEIMREMETDREGESRRPRPRPGPRAAPTCNHTPGTHCARVSAAAQLGPSVSRCGDVPHLCGAGCRFCSGFRRVEGGGWGALPVSRWRDGAPALTGAAIPDSAAQATDQATVVWSSRWRPRAVLGAWSQLGTDRSTNRRGRF